MSVHVRCLRISVDEEEAWFRWIACGAVRQRERGRDDGDVLLHDGCWMTSLKYVTTSGTLSVVDYASRQRNRTTRSQPETRMISSTRCVHVRHHIILRRRRVNSCTNTSMSSHRPISKQIQKECQGPSITSVPPQDWPYYKPLIFTRTHLPIIG